MKTKLYIATVQGSGILHAVREDCILYSLCGQSISALWPHWKNFEASTSCQLCKKVKDKKAPVPLLIKQHIKDRKNAQSSK